MLIAFLMIVVKKQQIPTIVQVDVTRRLNNLRHIRRACTHGVIYSRKPRQMYTNLSKV